MANKSEVCKFIEKNPPKLNSRGYYKWVAEQTGSNSETVRKYCKEMNMGNILITPLSKRVDFDKFEYARGRILSDKVTVEALRKFGLTKTDVKKVVKDLQNEGHNVDIIDGVVLTKEEVHCDHESKLDVPIFKDADGLYNIACVSDTHLGSKYERLDVLNDLYDKFAARGINVVLHGGNIIDGECRFNKYDIHKHGINDQVAYCLETYPKRAGLKTYFITADDHEGWFIQREHINIGNLIQLKQKEAPYNRDDLVHIGHMEHDIIIPAKKGKTIIRLTHPGMGSAYALSYTSQKLVESFQGGEKPSILLLGHYHKFEYCYPRDVHAVQIPCTMDQSPFMRKKRIQAHVGGIIIKFSTRPDGSIDRFLVEFIPYFDKGYHEKENLWKYEW